MVNLFILVLPLVIYLSLATLPMGRPAVMGLAVAGLLLVMGFVLTPAGGYLFSLGLLGAGLAAVAQALRWLAGPRLAPKLYFALLGLLPLCAIAALSVSVGA
ncbi:hypothetical protein [Pseudorhodobacter sp.]|jgi:hypothetical protein|uniref:hypothetical protein n=1 Tax=Pseudorhodobacter sp. TaxID=1934400 RepID=UPI002AFEFBFE|nr:hypothetical protein [Pseudorhodobacter sp.]